MCVCEQIHTFGTSTSWFKQHRLYYSPTLTFPLGLHRSVDLIRRPNQVVRHLSLSMLCVRHGSADRSLSPWDGWTIAASSGRSRRTSFTPWAPAERRLQRSGGGCGVTVSMVRVGRGTNRCLGKSGKSYDQGAEDDEGSIVQIFPQNSDHVLPKASEGYTYTPFCPYPNYTGWLGCQTVSPIK